MNAFLVPLLVAAHLAGCSGPDENKKKFYNRGVDYYGKADYVKACTN